MGTSAYMVLPPLADGRLRPARADMSGPGQAVSRRHARPSSIAPLVGAISLILAVGALAATIGGDARWLAALGRVIVARHAVPAGVPFAAAPSAHWPNALVLAELAFHGLERAMGDRGLMVAQLLAVGVGFAVLARDALEDGATADGTAPALLLAALGALPSLAIARLQLFSLALFPVLVALLRSEARRPSRRIWLVVVVLALWSNLHGGALIGLLVTLAYLLLDRSRKDPAIAVAVAIASALALCLTPALAETVTYYHGVLTNVAAERGVALWAPLSFSAPFDVVAILAAAGLAWSIRGSRPRLWEVAVLIGLALLSVRASRSSVWLLFFLVGPAARSISPRRDWRRLIPPATVAAVATIVFAIVRGPAVGSANDPLVSRAVAVAHGTPVLAPDLLAERIALDGGRIWLGNPLDAFSRRDQATYVDWLEGSHNGIGALTPAVRFVLVTRGSATERLMSAQRGYVAMASDPSMILYEHAR
jgi:hypothetical protein